jgi:hypothetical protein
MTGALKVWRIANSLIDLEVQSLGGMIGPARVTLGNRQFSPLAVAPWSEEKSALTLPPILQRLRGEWPCVPFGIVRPMTDFPLHWQAQDLGLDQFIDNRQPHGYGSNRHWHRDAGGSDWIELAVDYPPEFPIRRLRRRISLSPDHADIRITLYVEVRAACVLPIGLHPVFALSSQAGQCELRPGGFLSGRTYPLRFEPTSRLAIDARFDDLTKVPEEDGGSADLTRLPLT